MADRSNFPTFPIRLTNVCALFKQNKKGESQYSYCRRAKLKSRVPQQLKALAFHFKRGRFIVSAGKKPGIFHTRRFFFFFTFSSENLRSPERCYLWKLVIFPRRGKKKANTDDGAKAFPCR